MSILDHIVNLKNDNQSITFEYMDDQYCKDYDLYNNCTSSGDTVMIGQYDDDELLYISILHEVGHIKEKFDRNDILKKHMLDVCEVYAWRYAIMFSKISISNNIRYYIHDRLNSYFNKVWGADDELVGLKFEYRNLALIEALVIPPSDNLEDVIKYHNYLIRS